MMIKSLELKNVKSYEDALVNFEQGMNTICGPNGVGKTTLLEAIGFALFDYLPYNTHSAFVREGENFAEIAVSFLSDLDEREYQVVRRYGSHPSYYVYDPEIGARVAEGKEDVVLWIKNHLQIESSTNLSSIFSDAVGVPQGLLTTAFLETPRNRKNKFNPILRVDEYDRSFNKLLDTVNYIKELIQDQVEKIAELEGKVSRLPEVVKEANKLREELSQNEEELRRLKVDLTANRDLKEKLDLTRERIKELRVEVEVTEKELDGLNSQMEEAEKNLRRAEEAESVLQRAEDGFERYKKAQSELERLERQRKERDELRNRLNEYRSKISLTEQRIKTLEEQLSEVENAKERMKELISSVSEQEGLEEDLKGVQRDLQKLEEVVSRIDESEKELKDLSEELRSTDSEISELERLSKKADKVSELESKVEELKWKVIESRTHLKESQKGLEQSKDGTCPFLKETCMNLAQRNETLDNYFKSRIKEAKSSLLKAEEDFSDIQPQLAEAREAAKKVSSLPILHNQRERLKLRIEKEKVILSEYQDQVKQLEGSKEELKRIQDELDKLGDPRRDYDLCEEKVRAEEGIKEELEHEKKYLETLSGKKAEIEVELVRYSDLETQIEAQRRILKDNEDIYQLYLSNIEIAKSLSTRQKEAQKLRRRIENTSRRLSELESDLEEVSSGYKEDEHRKVAERYHRLESEVAVLGGAIKTRRGQLKRLKREIKSLQKLCEKMEREKAEKTELEGILSLVGFIRNALKEAGPYMTKAYVEIISREASRIFSDIMNDNTSDLHWDEEYEVKLKTGVKERVFKQLSGGEQMAAALAVRLALLKEISQIDIAFFDEPTSNLDTERRDNLADEILNVKGFSQLFVISHDDTFERVTDNIIRVHKENSRSWVERR